MWCLSLCEPPAQDCEDPNPLIRALAVRTMGCIRVDKITEYLCEPLRKCLKDEDPYVRKTAAVCVAKLHDINAQLVEDQGFLDTLKDLISDSNPMVWQCYQPMSLLSYSGVIQLQAPSLSYTDKLSAAIQIFIILPKLVLLLVFSYHLSVPVSLSSGCSKCSSSAVWDSRVSPQQ